MSEPPRDLTFGDVQRDTPWVCPLDPVFQELELKETELGSWAHFKKAYLTAKWDEETKVPAAAGPCVVFVECGGSCYSEVNRSFHQSSKEFLRLLLAADLGMHLMGIEAGKHGDESADTTNSSFTFPTTLEDAKAAWRTMKAFKGLENDLSKEVWVNWRDACDDYVGKGDYSNDVLRNVGNLLSQKLREALHHHGEGLVLLRLQGHWNALIWVPESWLADATVRKRLTENGVLIGDPKRLFYESLEWLCYTIQEGEDGEEYFLLTGMLKDLVKQDSKFWGKLWWLADLFEPTTMHAYLRDRLKLIDERGDLKRSSGGASAGSSPKSARQ